MRLPYFFLISVFLFACSDETVPKGVLPPKKMEAVWHDVIRADELVDFSIMQDSTYRDFSKRTALYDSIFHLHNIVKEDYRKSIAFYQTRPDLLKDILTSLRTTSDTALKRLSKDTATTR